MILGLLIVVALVVLAARQFYRSRQFAKDGMAMDAGWCFVAGLFLVLIGLVFAAGMALV